MLTVPEEFDQNMKPKNQFSESNEGLELISYKQLYENRHQMKYAVKPEHHMLKHHVTPTSTLKFCVQKYTNHHIYQVLFQNQLIIRGMAQQYTSSTITYDLKSIREFSTLSLMSKLSVP